MMRSWWGIIAHRWSPGTSMGFQWVNGLFDDVPGIAMIDDTP